LWMSNVNKFWNNCKISVNVLGRERELSEMNED